jgi:hypothetical protein
LPVRTAPTTRRSADANDEITPATIRVHPATVPSAPSCLNRRKTNTRLICVPTTGTVDDRALPAKTVAKTGRIPILAVPALNNRLCRCAKLAIDADSSPTARTSQIGFR